MIDALDYEEGTELQIGRGEKYKAQNGEWVLQIDHKAKYLRDAIENLEKRMEILEAYHESNKCPQCGKYFEQFFPQQYSDAAESGKFVRVHKECCEEYKIKNKK